jgi:hypothetical protein
LLEIQSKFEFYSNIDILKSSYFGLDFLKVVNVESISIHFGNDVHTETLIKDSIKLHVSNNQIKWKEVKNFEIKKNEKEGLVIEKIKRNFRYFKITFSKNLNFELKVCEIKRRD